MDPEREAPYGRVGDAALAMADGVLQWVGPRQALPAEFADWPRQDGQGAWVTPGFIDCHTHLVYGGDRAREFELRLQGASYEDIARAGGGIVSTVRATREAGVNALVAQSLPRLDALLDEGVTTLEVKSGYGLSLESEGRMLQAARCLAQVRAVRVRTTFLGAHAVPPEFDGRADAYIDEVLRMLPALHALGLVDAVDAFCERIAFSPAQTRRVFDSAQRLGLPVKLHAEQLSDSGGAALAAEFGALSADHLECLSEGGARAMAQAGTVAVMLPTAFYFLRDTRLPPIELLRRLGVPMAVATDCNPGSSPCTSILLAMNMACTLFRMTPEEVLAGVTRHAAQALGLSDCGVLAAGRRADLALWAVREPAQLCYAMGARPSLGTVVQGAFR